jgi:hypothetical protein
MRKLTYDEFQDRLQAEQRAKRIFLHMTGGDVAKAFEAYQDILAETQRPVIVPAASMQGMTGSAFDGLKHRPKCPECGMDMNLRAVPDNIEGVKSQLVCADPQCDVVLDSELTIPEWYDLLKKMGDEGTNETDE